MGFFPFYTDIQDKSCLIIGGGKVALRKAEKILLFGADITVISPQICKELEALPVKRMYRKFKDTDIDTAFFVIYAADAHDLAEHIAVLCRERNIPLNSVDDIENCSFIFPALAVKDSITISISTGGSSPVFAKYLKERIEAMLDERTINIGKLLSEYRSVIKQRYKSEDLRLKANEKLLESCLEADELPDDKEIMDILEHIE